MDEVLFIDDEPYFAARYVDCLREQFQVHFLARAEEVIPFLEENLNVKAVVLDIMMPPPKGLEESLTQNGLDTGLYLLQKMKYLGTWPFPVLILTARNPERIRAELSDRRLGDRFVTVQQKLHVPAPRLPELLRSELDRLG